MKKFINTAPPVVMTTNRQPLVLSLSINERNGKPLTQTQDKLAGEWAPNRNTNPLVFDPVATYYDPETGRTSNVPAANISWYLESIDAVSSEENETGLVTASWSNTGNYFLEKTTGTNPTTTGSLVVRKNVNYDKPVTIICVVQFTDSGRAESYRDEQSIIINSINKPSEFYSVVLKTPSVVEYRPITDASPQRTIEAVAYKGGEEVVFPFLTGIRFFWYYLKSGVWTLIPTDGTYAPYVSGNINGKSGSYASSVVLDADYIDHDTIKVMIAATPTYTAVGSPTGNPSTNGYFERTGSSPNYTYFPTSDTSVVSGKTYYALSSTATQPDSPSLSQCEITRVFPRIEALPYSTGGSAVNTGDKSKEFRAIVTADGVDMSDEKRDELIRLNWKSKPTNSNTITDRGWGNTTVISASDLMKTGSVNVEVQPDLYILSNLDVLTDDSPGGSGYVTDDSGSPTASANGGYVVGRT